MVASVVLAAFADAIEASRTTSYTTSAGKEWRWIVAEGRLVRPTMSLRANQWCSNWGRVVARDGTLTEVEIGGTYKSISVPVPGAAPGACGTSIMCKLHRIVCWTFHGGPRDASQTVDHVNRRCWDNRASNLRWATLEEQLSNRQRIQGTIEYVAELDEHGRMRSMLGASIRSNVAATQMLDVSREDLQGALKRAYCEIQDLHDSVRDSGSPENTRVTVNVKSGSGDAQQRLWLGITNLHAVQVVPHAQVLGADIDAKTLFQEDRIATFHVDQTNTASIGAMWALIKDPVDIIIDDGLHAFDANDIFLRASKHMLKPAEDYTL